IVLGEQAPKVFAIRKPLPTTLWISAPLHLFYAVFRPAIWFLNVSSNLILRHIFKLEPATESEAVHSEEELRVILSDSAESQEVSKVGKELLMNTLDLRRRVVRDIMTPRGEVVYLDSEKPFDENLKRATASRHTRFPICRSHLDNPLGLVHIKDVLAQMQQTPTPALIA